MAVKINIENRNRKRKIDLSKVKAVAKVALKELRKDTAELNITFFSSQKIRVLNRVYLGRDKATDVIAFPAGGKGTCIGFAGTKKDKFLGDIAISSDRASRNACSYGMTFMEELALYVIHGILHLSGHDDIRAKDRDKMRKKEDELIQKARKCLR